MTVAIYQGDFAASPIKPKKKLVIAPPAGESMARKTLALPLPGAAPAPVSKLSPSTPAADTPAQPPGGGGLSATPKPGRLQIKRNADIAAANKDNPNAVADLSRYTAESQDQATAANGNLRELRKAYFTLQNDRAMDPMQKAAQSVALRKQIGDAESSYNEINRAAINARRASMADTTDQSPEERQAARDRLAAQFPAARAAMVGQADTDLKSAFQRLEDEKARRAGEQRGNLANSMFPGRDMGSLRPRAETLAGDVLATQKVLNPDGIEQDIAAGSPWQQQRGDMRLAGLSAQFAEKKRLREMAGQAPETLTFDPMRPVDEEAKARTLRTAMAGANTARVGRETATAQAAAEAQTRLAMTKAEGDMAGAGVDLAKAKIATEKAGLGTEALKQQAEAARARTGVLGSERELADATANFDEASVRNAAQGLATQLSSASMFTLPQEAIGAVQSGAAAILTPLEELAKTGPDGAKRARAIAQELINQLPTPWSMTDLTNPMSPTSLMRQGMSMVKHRLNAIGS